jgi:hypothetical protein
MAVDNKRKNDFTRPGAVSTKGYIIIKAAKVFNEDKKKQSKNRSEWIGKKVRSKAGTEYVITSFGYEPGIYNFPDRYERRNPRLGLWMQRTDGTYQMRFLTLDQYNDLMVLDKKAGK